VAAAELPTVQLADALEVCALMATREPESYERAALRWLARFCLERKSATIADVRAAADALQLLRRDVDAGRSALRGLLASAGT